MDQIEQVALKHILSPINETPRGAGLVIVTDIRSNTTPVHSASTVQIEIRRA
jgi:hypothetical protein